MAEPAETRVQLRAKYKEALDLVWKKPDNCPICDSTWWSIGDLIDAPLRVHDMLPNFSFEAETRQAYVYAPVTCLYCGYSIFFHTGILDARLEEDIKTVPPLRAPEETP